MTAIPTLEKVFHFESTRGQYHCDAAVVSCFDSRFDLAFRKFLKRSGFENTDIIKLAGGAKCLASDDSAAQRALVLDQIRLSQRLHGTRKVILMVHSDCGGYGGLDAFDNDAEREAAHHYAELQKAAQNLRQAVAGVDVEAYFVDFAGVWKANL